MQSQLTATRISAWGHNAVLLPGNLEAPRLGLANQDSHHLVVWDRLLGARGRRVGRRPMSERLTGIAILRISMKILLGGWTHLGGLANV